MANPVQGEGTQRPRIQFGWRPALPPHPKPYVIVDGLTNEERGQEWVKTLSDFLLLIPEKLFGDLKVVNDTTTGQLQFHFTDPGDNIELVRQLITMALDNNEEIGPNPYAN